MKSRRRHSTSSEESAESVESADSESEESSSDSEASESGSSEPAKRHKKHKRREQSVSGSEESRRRSKKRKHKKKKKKRGKKRRQEESEAEESSQSETLERKHRRKRRHKSASRSVSAVEEEPARRVDERSRSSRLQSVVEDRRRSVSHHNPPRYYDYGRQSRERSRSGSRGRRERSRARSRECSEVEKFYRGSSKDRSHVYAPEYLDPGRYERGRPHEDHPRRDEHYEYRQRPPKYEQEDEYRERSYRDKEYNGRSAEYSRAPTCLLCGESHLGRTCRYQPRYDDRRPVPVRPDRERYERAPRVPHDERRRSSPDSHYQREERVHLSRDRGDKSRERVERVEPKERIESRERYRDEKPRELERDRQRERGDEERKERDRTSPRRKERKSRFEEDDGKSYSWGKTELKKETKEVEKDKPNFGLSGKLAADTNMVNGIVLKYSEPPDAKQPKRRWRLYPFKGDKALPILYIHRQSCFILGREHRAVDIPLEHPSISKQHAALQYRATPFQRPDGSRGKRVGPYVIDLDSANGTFVNNKKVEPRRFVELLERDVIKFGFSQREYVLLHENSKDDDVDEEMDAGTVTSIASVKRDKQVKQEQAHDGE